MMTPDFSLVIDDVQQKPPADPASYWVPAGADGVFDEGHKQTATGGHGFIADRLRYAGCSSAFRSAMMSAWMLPGTGRYLQSSIVKVPCPCVIERRSVE
jgi:hypothetical protein